MHRGIKACGGGAGIFFEKLQKDALFTIVNLFFN